MKVIIKTIIITNNNNKDHNINTHSFIHSFASWTEKEGTEGNE